MATQAQLDALRAALYSGELRVSFEGKTIEYRSVNEIRIALQAAEDENAAEAGTRRRRIYLNDPPRQRGWSR